VVVVTEPLAAGRPLGRALLRRATELREVPVRFAPPDSLMDAAEAIDRKPLAAVPAGSYLLASHLRPPGGEDERQPRLAGDLHPVEITVTGAGPLAAVAPTLVDVVVAGEPVTGGKARVHVAAAAVRLMAVEPAAPEDGSAAGGDSWNATLALERREALQLIEAENFAREIRLIPAS
jgi:hypothetical protein